MKPYDLFTLGIDLCVIWAILLFAMALVSLF
jgi:hypothetical protein